jgi:ATP synthase F1 gamma subunit
MINTKAIATELDMLNSMKLLIQAYEEIAANRMRRIRSTVLASRDYNLGLDSVYQNLLLSYKKQVDEILSQKRGKDNRLLMERNGKNVAVFMSANTGLYGDILKKTYQQFIEFTKSHRSDLAIIGKYGTSLFQSEYPSTPFTFFDFPDMNISDALMSKFISFILQYENIYIFYGKFNSMASQVPTVLDVFGEEEESMKKNTDRLHKYLFEPSLETILVFFEKEIFASIISQTIRESELAKYAARMVALDSSVDKVNKSLTAVVMQERVARHREQNKKMLEAVSALRLLKLR